MRIGYTGWTWLSDEHNGWAPMSDKPRRDFEQFLRDVSDLGYETIENFDFTMDYYRDDEAALAALCKKYSLEFANLYFYFTADPQKDDEKAARCVEFMKKIGAGYMNCQGVMWNTAPLDRPMDRNAIVNYAERCDKIGELCAKNGIKLCMHPHACTNIYTEAEIDLFLEKTNPRYVYLCLDTAHLTLAGMDPAKEIEKVSRRIGYMHFKDLDGDASLNPEWPLRRFRPLGYGIVDFSGAVKALKKTGYDDIICVEVDYQPVCNYKTAMDCRNYIHSVLGLM